MINWDKTFDYLILLGLVVIIAILAYLQLTAPRFPVAPETTGAIIDQTVKPNLPLEQFYQLMEETPIVEDSFTITSDYDEIILMITLKEPLSDSQQKFYQWLAVHGYGQISPDKMVFTSAK